MSTGELHMIIGPMYAGKTESIIRLLHRYQTAGLKCLAINHSFDNRTDEDILASHSGKKYPAIKTSNLNMVRTTSEVYQISDVVAIDEAQFFDDLESQIKLMVETDEKIILLSGLDGDFERQPFGHVLNLIPFADSVQRLEAFCVECKDGQTAGIFSKRIDSATEIIHVGSLGSYHTVCRKHYLENYDNGHRN